MQILLTATLIISCQLVLIVTAAASSGTSSNGTPTYYQRISNVTINSHKMQQYSNVEFISKSAIKSADHEENFNYKNAHNFNVPAIEDYGDCIRMLFARGDYMFLYSEAIIVGQEGWINATCTETGRPRCTCGSTPACTSLPAAHQA